MVHHRTVQGEVNIPGVFLPFHSYQSWFSETRGVFFPLVIVGETVLVIYFINNCRKILFYHARPLTIYRDFGSQQLLPQQKLAKNGVGMAQHISWLLGMSFEQ